MFQAISKNQGLQNFFSHDVQNFNNSKNTAVFKPRIGQFSRTWGFEAKAKSRTWPSRSSKGHQNASSRTSPLVIKSNFLAIYWLVLKQSWLHFSHTIDSLLEDWKLTVLSFFIYGSFIVFRICRFVQSAWLFSFTVHMFYKYVESNWSNTRDRKKPSQVQDQPLFLQCSPLFLRASVFSLLQ